jgi:mannosyl-oligosaccharide glucosidase
MFRDDDGTSILHHQPSTINGALMPFIHLISCVLSILLLLGDASGNNVTDPSLLWGPYRSNLYVGLRPRIPQSLSIGLMWSTVEDGQLNADNLRHACEQKDGMSRYGWTAYDPRKGGTHTIVDPGNGLELITEFTKLPDGPKPGNWGLRVTGHVTDAWSKSRNVSVIIYVALEKEPGAGPALIECEAQQPLLDSVECKGTASGLDAFTISIPAAQSIKDHPTVLRSLNVVDDQLWDAKCESRC